MHGSCARLIGVHQVVEALCNGVGLAAVDQLLLNAMQLRELAKESAAAQFAEQIGEIAEGGICGDAAEPIRASALQSDGQRRERRRCSRDAVGLNQCRKGLVEGAAHQCRFAAGSLLIEDQNGLGHLRVARTQLVQQHARLRVLAAEAKDGCARYVGVVNVARKQSAKRLRILTSTAAAALVRKKANAVDVGEDSLCAGWTCICGSMTVAAGLLLHQTAHVAAVAVLRAAVAQFFFKGLFEPVDVAVFAKDERQYQPVIP